MILIYLFASFSFSLFAAEEAVPILPDRGYIINLSSENNYNWSLFSSCVDDNDEEIVVDANISSDHCRNYVNRTIHIPKARVPGDVVYNLFEAGVIPDPYFGTNFLRYRSLWLGDNIDIHDESQLEQRTLSWTYETVINLSPKTHKNNNLMLIFEQVKMGARVFINGEQIFCNEDKRSGDMTDQFVRYSFDVPSRKSDGKLITKLDIKVVFDPCISTNGRFMACSGGWDWAPYSLSGDDRGSRTFTFGIVGDIYLISFRDFVVFDIAPRVKYLGKSPKRQVQDMGELDSKFQVTVSTNTYALKGFAGKSIHHKIQFKTDFSRSFYLKLENIEKGFNKIDESVIVDPRYVDLWWPHSLGGQPLYFINATLFHEHDDSSLSSGFIVKYIGFRIADLITYADEDECEGRDGSGTHGMAIRINGALMFCRGSNVVPIDQVEGRFDDDIHRQLVLSSKAANINMLRVWGGGIVFPPSFYDACDEFGILVYHDMLYVEEQFHAPDYASLQEYEIKGVIRRLLHHPSIVLWSGCNECDVVMGTASEIYATFVMKHVVEEDDTRIIWPSSPSKGGWKSGVDACNGKPNGENLTTPLISDIEHFIEVHGPYFHGSSATHPCVNGGLISNLYDPQLPPRLNKYSTGWKYQNQFVSEFGASVFSSFESMSSFLEEAAWGIHGGSPPDECKLEVGNVNTCKGSNVLAQRNYPCDNHIQVYFGEYNLDLIGSFNFQRQLYHCMLGQALLMKSNIEIIRSKNSFGALTWQLNENWPTGGWGALEFGGRWKPLMYFLRKSLFKNIFVACGVGGLCYVKNDGHQSVVNGTLVVESWNIHSGSIEAMHNIPLQVLSGGGESQWFDIDEPKKEETNHTVWIVKVLDLEGNTIAESFNLFTTPGHLLIRPLCRINFEVVEDEHGAIKVLISATLPALWVVLTTDELGYFSDNCFFLFTAGDTKTIEFIPFNSEKQIDIKEFHKSLRIEHAGMYTNKETNNNKQNNSLTEDGPELLQSII